LPDYDFQWENYLNNQWQVHHDMTADSSILNARFSFHWRPLLNDTVFEELHRWSVEQTPTVIIMGNFNFN
jgi:hypothetical protein